MAKYDDASWHADGEFPEDLNDEAGATHIGMFFAWAALSGLASDEVRDELQPLQERATTPGQYLLNVCDGKLDDSMLTPTGNAFAAKYYPDDYMSDYTTPDFGDVPSIYHVEDSWTTFDQLSPLLDRRFREWQNPLAKPKSLGDRLKGLLGQRGGK
jgi:hypothetical protein